MLATVAVIVSTRRPALIIVSSPLDARRAGHPAGAIHPQLSTNRAEVRRSISKPLRLSISRDVGSGTGL